VQEILPQFLQAKETMVGQIKLAQIQVLVVGVALVQPVQMAIHLQHLIKQEQEEQVCLPQLQEHH
jgi:hypothetical protein